MTTPTIRTGRLTLRPFSEAHLTERYIAWLNDPLIVRYSENRHRQHDLASCRTYYESMITAGHLFWAVHENDGNTAHVGNITAYLDRPNGVADVAIMIGERNALGRGYGKEAWCAAVEALIHDLGMRRVQAGTMADNAAMRAVFRASGMAEECRQRARFLLDGRAVDMVTAARIRSDRSNEKAS